ncbi:MAG: hypothetical protein A3H63_02195 [Candidatus Harrisonbacteria bacterium RIFCSPLOWO2_02_FULL_45_10c]|uniref:TVP38/TMEM64 family membrane protein n=1 Tax=Candidatus Harrisonbacteria bacterium RIFCSPLOWO2_02_FULL_45_10c TaxID=1798410 RepID=A0A1G1ZVD2_9BACT|nr:MAG: hypothetical protein A3H63_02195 [Candidatus Harrisonbacteria bacterium RIFCSPLOWO2_02_FULL_45_10c]
MESKKYAVIRDIGIVTISILVAINLVQTGVIHSLLGTSRQLRFAGSFISGILFTSVFTTAPATATLAEIAQDNSVLLIAIIGAFGALVGDLVIFRFIKDSVTEDIAYLIKKAKKERFLSIFRLKVFRWLIPFIGAVIIASPLPDEIGIAMMGFSKLRISFFIPISFSLNFVGILIIGLIARL